MTRTDARTVRRRLGTLTLAVTPLLAGSALAQAPAAPPYPITAVDTAHGDREFHLLWPGGAPGALGNEAVDKPKVTVYLAPDDRATGAAVVVCPGGGYQVVAADHEGKQIALWLNSLGVSAFVLQYRLGERYHHPVPLEDAQRAIRMVRRRSKEWHVDPKRIGILGFSAGGHLASTAATHFDDGRPDAPDPVDRESSRPDFAVLCYAVISLEDPTAHAGSRRNLLGDPPDPALVVLLSNEKQVTPRTPPTFLWHTADDTAVPVENSLLFFAALHKAGVPGELHVFPHGRHGLGLAPGDPAVSQWPRLCAIWMEGLGLLKKP
jgi:acetyl esterase/lipase